MTTIAEAPVATVIFALALPIVILDFAFSAAVVTVLEDARRPAASALAIPFAAVAWALSNNSCRLPLLTHGPVLH